MCNFNECTRKTYKDTGYCWNHRGQINKKIDIVEENVEVNITENDNMILPKYQKCDNIHSVVDWLQFNNVEPICDVEIPKETEVVVELKPIKTDKLYDNVDNSNENIEINSVVESLVESVVESNPICWKCKINISENKNTRCQPCKDAQKAKIAKRVAEKTNKQVVQPVVESVAEPQENFESNIVEAKPKTIEMSEIIESKRYDQHLFDLCAIIHQNWFKQRDNLWKLAGLCYTTPGESTSLMRRTYCAILYTKLKRFSIKDACNEFDLWKDSKYHCKLTITELKRIAGGCNSESYKKWKTTYDPEQVQETKTTKSKKASKILLVDEFKNKIIKIANGMYKREYGTGVIYEKQLPYYYTRKYEDPMQFLNKILSNDERYRTLKPNDCNNLLNFIKVIECPGFDFMRLDHNYIGFNNGIYDMNLAEFTPTENIVGNIQVRKLIAQEFKITETPLLDNYLRYQFHDDDIEFIYFLLGRMMTRLDDRFDFMVLLFGQGGSGKSLLMKLLQQVFTSDQIGILSSAFQGQFGLCEFANRQIVCSDDMPTNLAKTLDKGDFLKMMTRGAISCPVKGKSSIEVHDWNLPTLINSNFLPNYKDISGEIVRRVMVINFEKIIPEDMKNTSLEADIIANEICTFIHRCRSTYVKYKQLYHGKSVESFCPQIFLDNRKLLSLSVNSTCAFIDERCEYSEDDTMTLPELNKVFKLWLVDRYSLQRKPTENLNPQSIESVDSRYSYKNINICKSCKSKHQKNCCKQYTRTNRTSTNIVYNICLKSSSSDPSDFSVFK